MKVYIGCFGSGLGHASRMLEIARELTARGVGLVCSSSGEVASMIQARGYPCNRLPLADVRYSESGAFLLKDTLLSSASIIGRTCQQVWAEVANIGRFGPDVVLSDSALSTVLAARTLRLPTFTVLNQLNLTSSHRPTGALPRAFSAGLSTLIGGLWELSDEVILPDLPPPYTISERNLWGSNVEKTRYVGFLTSSETGEPDDALVEFRADRRPKVFWQVSGPPRTRAPFLRLAIESLRALSDRYAFVASAGDPNGSLIPRRIAGGWYYEWCGIAGRYFETCDLVISRAGHGTMGQTIVSSKPSLLVPIPKQPEQEGNADKASRLGVSLVVEQDELSLERLTRSIEALLSEGFSERARGLGRIARSYDAKAEIVNAVEAASRARPRPH